MGLYEELIKTKAKNAEEAENKISEYVVNKLKHNFYQYRIGDIIELKNIEEI